MSSVKFFYPKWTRETLTEALKEGLGRLSEVLPVERAALFGSWSRGRATVASDVDVLTVSRGEVQDDAYKLAWWVLGVRGLELHACSKLEAERVAPTLERMTQGGICLYEQALSD